MALTQLVETMYDLTGYQKSNLAYILSKLPESIETALEKDGAVRINGLGTFSLKTKKAGKVRNPQTGGTIDMPERTIVHFRLHKSLRDKFENKTIKGEVK